MSDEESSKRDANSGEASSRGLDPEEPTLLDDSGVSRAVAGEAVAEESSTSGWPPARYQLGERLGEGGMAVVYEATDRDLKRTVAVKCLRTELAKDRDVRQRFLDEAEIMGGLDHPGAVAVHEVGVLDDGQTFLAMKRVKGQTLKELLASRGAEEIRDRPSLIHFVDFYEQVCQMVAAAHREGVIHRDLKPENVMADEDGSVYVMDWGLAKRLPTEVDPGDDSRTRYGMVMGTPAYMSPEQAQGQAHSSDRQTDVFSLGVMLYEILTGTKPFRGADAGEIMKRVLFHDPAPPRKLNPRTPRALSAVCMKALDKDPERRYASAVELAADIRSYREFRPVSAIKPSVLDRLSNASRRHPRMAAILATLAIVTVLGGVAVAFQSSVEAVQANEMYEELDRTRMRLGEIDAEMEGVEEDLLAASLTGSERAALELRLAELEAEREVRVGRLRGFAAALVGFTIFAPDEEAQRLGRDSALDTIRFHLEDGDLVRARAHLRGAIEILAVRNWLGYSDEEQAWLREQLAEVEAALDRPSAGAGQD